MKKCRQCGVKKKPQAFPLGKSHKGGRRQPCRACCIAGHRKLVDAIKAAPCVDCGGQFLPECMDFDHVRGEKVFSIASAIGSRKSWEAILAEILKCDLVCANCHRVRTRQRKMKKAP